MKIFFLKLTAVFMSAFFFFGGVAGSYIEGFCADVGYRFVDTAWNYNDSVWENIYQYLVLAASVGGCYFDPTLASEDKDVIYTKLAEEFVNYLDSDKGIELTEEEIPQYFEDNVSTIHESEDGTIHGGGGIVLSDDLVDALHHTAQAILDEQSGYWLVSTLSPEDPFWVSKISDSAYYEAFKNNVKNLGKEYVFAFSNMNTNQVLMLSSELISITPSTFISSYQSGKTCGLGYISPDWTTIIGGYMFKVNSSFVNILKYSSELSLDTDLDTSTVYSAFLSKSKPLFTSDGRPVRVWKNVDAYKLFSVNKQPYYYTPEWVNYDYSQDNSITLTNTYLGNVVNGGVVNNYYSVVQDAIDENNTDGSLTEDQIRDIVADTINQIQQDNNTESDSGGSGSDDNGSGGGIGAVIDGIGKFFDTLLTLVGKIIGMLSDFVNSVLTMFESFTVFTDGFSGFLTGAFGFIPPEAINVLVTGMTLLVILAIIKFLK